MDFGNFNVEGVEVSEIRNHFSVRNDATALRFGIVGVVTGALMRATKKSLKPDPRVVRDLLGRWSQPGQSPDPAGCTDLLKALDASEEIFHLSQRARDAHNEGDTNTRDSLNDRVTRMDSEIARHRTNLENVAGRWGIEIPIYVPRFERGTDDANLPVHREAPPLGAVFADAVREGNAKRRK